jgi:hypothetical protein
MESGKRAAVAEAGLLQVAQVRVGLLRQMAQVAELLREAVAQDEDVAHRLPRPP